jgi:uncharacterized protein (DUF2164 family)
MAIKLSPDTAEKAAASLRRYCEMELEHPIGELPSQLFLQFIVEEIGPSIYNAAIGDAQTYFRDRLVDLEGACYEPEFGHSARAGRRPKR